MNSTTAAAMDLVLERYRTLLYASRPPPPDLVRKFADSLKADGTWPDISYHDRSPAVWKTSEHLDRVRVMLLALTLDGKSQKDAPKIRRAMERALDNWCAKRYRGPTFWWNEITTPRAMREIAVLLGKDLTGDRRKAVLEIMGQCRVAYDGANLMFGAELSLHHGCLTRNEKQATEAAQRIWAEIVPDKRNGIQSDGSYYEHGSRLQTFHYGRGYLDVVSTIAWQLRGTPWAIPPEKRELVSHHMIEGADWMRRGTATVPGTMDRAASRQGALGASLGSTLRLWQEIDPDHREAFRAILLREAGKGPPLAGYRHFPKSDFTVYHRPEASFFLKTVSERTGLTESINGENLKGVPFLNGGDHYILQEGRSYQNLQPLWQWQYLPGLTMLPEDTRPKRLSFVGGLGQGTNGLTAMDYLREGTNGAALGLRKSWFFHGDLVICLMSATEIAKTRGPVVSSLEQCRLRGPVVCRQNLLQTAELKPGRRDLGRPLWILHDRVGYLPMNINHVTVALETRQGSWHDIAGQYPTNNIQDSVFQILAEHDRSKESQGWIIVLGATAAKLDALVRQTPWKILRNDRDVQSVRFDNVVSMAAFFAPGSAADLAVDKPCLALWNKDRAWLSDPTMRGQDITLTWKQKEFPLKLPGGAKVVECPPAAGTPSMR